MTHSSIDWTHKEISIVDIRKLNKLYVIRILLCNPNQAYKPITEIEPIEKTSLFIKDTIFEERLRSYFLKDITKISREEILGVKWNMYISKGYFIKINENGETEQFDHDPEKWYVSYLEISGPLGTFSSVYREKEVNK